MSDDSLLTVLDLKTERVKEKEMLRQKLNQDADEVKETTKVSTEKLPTIYDSLIVDTYPKSRESCYSPGILNWRQM